MTIKQIQKIIHGTPEYERTILTHSKKGFKLNFAGFWTCNSSHCITEKEAWEELLDDVILKANRLVQSDMYDVYISRGKKVLAYLKKNKVI